MTTKKLFPRLIVAFLVISSLMAQAQPGRASPAKALDTLTGCSFGYALQSLPPQWIDIHLTGEKLLSLEGDDQIISRSIGFPFRFFENTYSSIFISSNGFISFGSQNENAYSNNYPIPAEYAPNNMLAGFWDDLTVGGTYNSGSVYFQVTGSSPNRQAVIAWVGVTRLRAADPLTFEIVINETSDDIQFNYGSLNGDLTQATVGIEDADGIDGCQLVYNAAGLESNQSVKLAYPANGARVKAKPSYQGQFLVNGLIDLPFTLVNTGSNSDTFNFQLAVLQGAGDWPITVVGPNKLPMVNSPALASKGTYGAFIRVKAAKGAPVGSFVKGQLTVASNTNPAKTFTIRFDAAIPAPFTEFYVDSSAGYVRYILPHLQQTISIFPSFTGSSFTIARIANYDYALSWEYIQRDVQYYENIQKAVLRPVTGLKSPVTDLVDNTYLSTLDANPVLAVAPNGTIGMVFSRSIRDVVTKELNTNIYFARLDANGNLLLPLKKLTNNATYTFDVLYNVPVIAATTQNQFVIAYEKMTPANGTTFAKDIDIAVLDSNGEWISQPHHVTDSENDRIEYFTPSVTKMLDGKVFLAFLSRPIGDPLGQIVYTTVQPGDGSISTITPLNNAYGEGARSATLNDGTILLAWINDGSLSAGYTLFPQGNLAGVLAPATLNSANGWKIENISLTNELFGNGVVTWQDVWGYHLYYALVAPDGALITPPMAFLRGSNPGSPNIISSSSGKGTAPLDLFWPAYLPITRR